MWKYVKLYLPQAIIAGLFMVGEVLMDLVQPGLMSEIVDDGVLGLHSGGMGNLNLIWTLGLQMIGLVLIGGLSGSMCNVFSHISSQNIGNEMRKDAFRRMMAFSFPQMDRFGTGSLVTRVTNDITQVQLFVASFSRGLTRTSMLTLGSMYFMFRLNGTFLLQERPSHPPGLHPPGTPRQESGSGRRDRLWQDHRGQPTHALL